MRLTITEPAEAALNDVRAGFDRLSAGLKRMKEAASGGILTVTVSPAFATKWLIPRLDRFQSRCPETDVRLDTSLKLLDYAAQGIDIGVRYGKGNWPDLVADKLMEEEIYPVASPSLLARVPMVDLGDIENQVLIHDLSVDAAAGFTTWETWLLKAGTGDRHQRGLRINNSAAVLQAAIDGQGIALARSILARDDIAAGRLIRLFPKIRVQSALAYYVTYRSELASLPRLIAFRDWLVEEADPLLSCSPGKLLAGFPAKKGRTAGDPFPDVAQQIT